MVLCARGSGTSCPGSCRSTSLRNRPSASCCRSASATPIGWTRSAPADGSGRSPPASWRRSQRRADRFDVCDLQPLPARSPLLEAGAGRPGGRADHARALPGAAPAARQSRSRAAAGHAPEPPLLPPTRREDRAAPVRGCPSGQPRRAAASVLRAPRRPLAPAGSSWSPWRTRRFGASTPRRRRR